MKKAILLTIILTVLGVCSAYAQTLNEPEKKYTEEEIAQRILDGDDIAFTDIFFAEGSDMPMPMAVSDIDSTLYYDQLTDYEKTLYNGYASSADNMKDGVSESELVHIEIPVSGADKDNYNQKIQEATGYPLVKLLSRPAYVYFYMDHPEKFWVDLNKLAYGISINIYKDSISIDTQLHVRTDYEKYWPGCYTSQEQLNADIQAMDSKVNEIISALPENVSDFYKVKYFTEWLTRHNTYNTYIANKSKYPKEFIDTLRYPYIAPSALLYGEGDDDTKYPVCEGYAEAFKILCNETGVKAMCMTSSTHKWNAVKLGGRFYFCDPTWCDTTGYSNTMQNYTYLLIGTEKMKELDGGHDHDIVYQTVLEAPPIAQKMYIEDMGFPVYNTRTYNYRYLDIDKNNLIEIDDARELLRQAAGINRCTAQDMNGDGKVDLKDGICFTKLLLNTESRS